MTDVSQNASAFIYILIMSDMFDMGRVPPARFYGSNSIIIAYDRLFVNKRNSSY